MSASTAIIFFPLFAALIYVFGALLLKRSSDLGVGLWRTTFVANEVVALLFSTLWFRGGAEIHASMLWQPAMIAVCLFIGQLAQFFALEKGDISIAVPVFGLKVVLVAFLTPMLTGDVVGARQWLGALLSVIGVTLLNRKDNGVSPRNMGVTLLWGGIGAVCFATFDVLVQKWGPVWGSGHLLPMIFWINAVFSFALIRMFKAPLRSVATAAWPWLLMGSALLGTQSILFVSTLATYGSATTANIIYASRGLLSIALVWLIGHWFGNEERHLGASVMRWRLAGAALMLSAIACVIWK